MWYWRGNLSPHFVWVWGFSLTQACLSGFLLFGPVGYKGTRRGGHLELCPGNRAPIAMYRKWGTEGLSLKPRCIGPERARTPISFYSILFYSRCLASGPQALRLPILAMAFLVLQNTFKFLDFIHTSNHCSNKLRCQTSSHRCWKINVTSIN